MAPLEHTSAQVLEFGALRDLVRGYAFSPLGQARVSALEPVSDLEWIEDQQQMAAEIREFLRAGGRFDFAGLLDPRKELSQARIRRRGARSHADSRDPAGGRSCRRVERGPSQSAECDARTGRRRLSVAGNCTALLRTRRLYRPAAVLSQQDHAGRHARRSRLAGAGAHSPRDREADAHDSRIAAPLSAPSLRRRHRCRKSWSPFAASASSFP